MDRPDELKERVLNATRDDEDSVVRDGDILGLGGSPVPKSPGDPSASHDAESVHRRRERALGEDERVHGNADPHTGATGIDMGSGGHGTDLSGD